MRRPRASQQVEGSEGDGGATAIAGGSEEVVGAVGMRSAGYEECIGAKKHLVKGQGDCVMVCQILISDVKYRFCRRSLRKDGLGEEPCARSVLSDIHRLLDLGYVTISRHGHFEVGRRLNEHFE